MQAAATSHSLIARVREDDERAWSEFVAIYYPMVYRWCRQSGLNPDDSSDISQNVFRALVDGLNSYRHTAASRSFRRWLRGVTRHKLQDFWRVGRTCIVNQNNIDPAEVISDESQLAGEDEEESDLTLAVRRSLEFIRDDVEPQTWQAAWKVLVEEESPADVAQELGMSVNAVYKARARIVRRVREQLCDLLD